MILERIGVEFTDIHRWSRKNELDSATHLIGFLFYLFEKVIKPPRFSILFRNFANVVLLKQIHTSGIYVNK